MELPEALRYTREHEWVRLANDQAVVGITRYAVEQLGDVVYVDLPAAGHRVAAGQPFGTVESVKSLSDLFSPLSGVVSAVNTNLNKTPELVNEDPYGNGWMIQIQPDRLAAEQDSLLTASDYRSWLAGN